MNKPWILPVIVISQFLCTSMWFASNGVMDDLIYDFNLNASALAHLTSAVQMGFIVGTLVFALLTIADRFPPSAVFFFSAIVASIFNLGAVWGGNSLNSLVAFRFITGFFLAGIYPVGMKILADYYEKGLGKSLGYLVAALVLGTGFPHLLKGFSGNLPWFMVIVCTSCFSLLGGFLMWYLVPDGPHRKPGKKLDLGAFMAVFRKSEFRAAAFGYFGHMWELFAFWAFIPLILTNYMGNHAGVDFNIPLWSFLIIALGGLACILAGYLSIVFGTKKTASISLMLSSACCLSSPIFFIQGSPLVLLTFLVFWGLVVIADSPLFSTLVANNALPEHKGTALTIVNCIGFAITILSIQLISLLAKFIDPSVLFVFLAVGPLFGLLGLWKGRYLTNITE